MIFNDRHHLGDASSVRPSVGLFLFLLQTSHSSRLLLQCYSCERLHALHINENAASVVAPPQTVDGAPEPAAQLLTVLLRHCPSHQGHWGERGGGGPPGTCPPDTCPPPHTPPPKDVAGLFCADQPPTTPHRSTAFGPRVLCRSSYPPNHLI